MPTDIQRRAHGQKIQTTMPFFAALKLTPAIRAALYAEAGAYADRDSYVSDMALSSVWGDAKDEEIPAERLALLGGIWDGAHCTIPELIEKYGLTQTGFAQYFNVPCVPCSTGASATAPARRM